MTIMLCSVNDNKNKYVSVIFTITDIISGTI